MVHATNFGTGSFWLASFLKLAPDARSEVLRIASKRRTGVLRSTDCIKAQNVKYVAVLDPFSPVCVWMYEPSFR